MHIEIEVPRPVLTLLLIAGVIAAIVWAQSDAPVRASVKADTNARVMEDVPDAVGASAPSGGNQEPRQAQVQEAESSIRDVRVEQEIRARKEELLRYQLSALEEERRSRGTIDEESEEEFRDAVRALTTLLQDDREAEQYLLTSLHQLWEAEGVAETLGNGRVGTFAKPVHLFVPVPFKGITARFMDAAYRKFWHFDHKGTDFRAAQGTTVVAVDDGVVAKTLDAGMGFSYVVIQHDWGTTLYGHVSKILVEEGQEVRAGDEIALSGGMPGTDGAGPFTDGPHLHVEMRIKGELVDILDYMQLPEIMEEDAASAQ
jgi:murein DD-endopeptidase MepM/ murein hydrolase activator NlpD